MAYNVGGAITQGIYCIKPENKIGKGGGGVSGALVFSVIMFY